MPVFYVESVIWSVNVRYTATYELTESPTILTIMLPTPALVTGKPLHAGGAAIPSHALTIYPQILSQKGAKMKKQLTQNTTSGTRSEEDRPPKDVLDRLLEVLVALGTWFLSRLFKKWF